MRYSKHSVWRTCLFLASFLAFASAYATHNRAGEITYEQIGELTIRVTITTYTKTSSFQADRDTLDIYWGDGSFSKIGRINGEGDLLPNDIKRNFYVTTHTYPGRGTYTMYFTDPNRIANILNIDPPNSIRIRFHISTTFTFLSSQFQGSNSSAILLQPPIDYACVGQRFIHNANAYDPDGDSLSYELIVPFEDVGKEVPNYSYPDMISPGSQNRLTLDERTGDIIWDAPQRAGEYNIAFKIHEYRKGVLLNSIIRDMQILVENCDNRPPAIETIDEICVVAGETVSFPVTATDPDGPSQQIALTALGGPFSTPISPATFSLDGSYQDQPVTGIFTWQTQCEHISQHAYSVVFKAVDDTRDTSGLATLKTVLVKVIGPPPENLVAEQSGTSNYISWDLPYRCDMTEDDYFIGFTVWRRTNSNRFLIDTCNPGLEGKGYIPIAYGVKDNENERYFYIDNDVTPGLNYCYRVTATFGQLSIAGYRYNLVESLPSNEDCAGLILDRPYITKVSVLTTDPVNGVVECNWTKPDPEDFDTTAFGGPYRLELHRGEGFNPATLQPVAGAQFSSPNFTGLTDTLFIDNMGLNTTDQVYAYQVLFYASGNFLFSRSDIASTVRLESSPSDQGVNLSWQVNAPWQNYAYRIFRRHNLQMEFQLIDVTTETTYTDTGLQNQEEYCYYIETEGTYGIDELPSPLFNLSQIVCEVPEDVVPPCIPVLNVQNSCNDPNLSSGGTFINRLNWNFNNTCQDRSDIAGYRIYYKPRSDTSFILLDEIAGNTTTYDHRSESGLPGCYGITSLDSLGNESDTSNVVCVTNCPFYQLPNVFTPNGDGANDLFIAFPYQFIDRVDMKIFNRWGQLVFETTNPDIEWDGSNLAGNELSEGVYTYICEVFESSSDGVTASSNVLRGFIELLR
jgi:gliding motility-associated-like protein